MSTNARRNLLITAAAVTAWYVIILFTWALKPLTDAVPVGTDETGKPASQTVECNTLFAPTPRPPGNVPVLTNLFYEYNRIPCVAVQRDARIVFALDTLFTLVVVAGLLVVSLRSTARGAASLAIA